MFIKKLLLDWPLSGRKGVKPPTTGAYLGFFTIGSQFGILYKHVSTRGATMVGAEGEFFESDGPRSLEIALKLPFLRMIRGNIPSYNFYNNAQSGIIDARI